MGRIVKLSRITGRFGWLQLLLYCIIGVDSIQVHVEDYKLGLYSRIPATHHSNDDTSLGSLTGFQVGNHHVPGCLTSDRTARIHSCEPGTTCHAELTKSGRVIWITPIISRSKEGLVLREPGAGGSGFGSTHQSEIEIDNIASSKEIEDFFRPLVKNPADLATLMYRMESALATKDGKIILDGPVLDTGKETSLQVFLERLLSVADFEKRSDERGLSHELSAKTATNFKQIHFPYARHSSYQELCDLVATFQPRDIYPCTVDEQTWDEEVSMEALFGHICSDKLFNHDEDMRLRPKTISTFELGNDEKPGNIHESSQSSLRTTNPDTQDEAGAEASGTLNLALGQLTPREDRAPIFPSPNSSTDGSGLDPGLVAIQSAFECYVGREDRVEASPAPLTEEIEEIINAEPLTPGRDLDREPSPIMDAGPNASLQLKKRVGKVPRSGSKLARSRSMRTEAYQAALLLLATGESAAWDDIGVGSVGHTRLGEAEEEL